MCTDSRLPKPTTRTCAERRDGLAFGHYVTTSGLRAALHGQPDARNNLALALVLSGLTALAYRVWPRESPAGRR